MDARVVLEALGRSRLAVGSGVSDAADMRDCLFAATRSAAVVGAAMVGVFGDRAEDTAGVERLSRNL